MKQSNRKDQALKAILATTAVQLVILLLASPTFSEPAPKSGRSGDVQDTNLINCPRTREDYFLRHPFAEKAERMTKRKIWQDYPKYTVLIGPTKQDGTTSEPEAMIKLPPAQTIMRKADVEAREGDKKHFKRPQYRFLIKPCGGPGYFILPELPIIMSSSSLPPKYPHKVPWSPVPNPFQKPCYIQPRLSHDNKNNIAQPRDEELWEYEATTFGVGPISDTQFQIIDRLDNQRFVELVYDPERWMWVGKAASELQRQGMASVAAGAAEASFDTAVFTMEEPLINIANEYAAQPINNGQEDKTLPQAIYMVQQMYKYVFTPMAILFLLPGVILTQVKGLVSFGMISKQDEDTVSPFSGILRSIIAVFLIPATQLIVSYAIDIGNSMTYEVKRYVDHNYLFQWAHQQTYNPPVHSSKVAQGNNVNYLGDLRKFPNVSDEKERRIEGYDLESQPDEEFPLQGKGAEVREGRPVVEKLTDLSAVLHLGYNIMNWLMSNALVILTSFQLVMMCYLFLMGPIAACLFAWPAGVGKGLFKQVFANWLDAVIVLALWRFWWMVVLACMCTRIAWLKESGDYTPNTQWEMMMFTCFMGLLMYVPFQPFKFEPGEAAVRVLEEGAKAAKIMGGATEGMMKQAGMSPAEIAQTQQQLTTVADQAALVSRGMSGQHTGLFPDTMPPSADPRTQRVREEDARIRERTLSPYTNSAVNFPPLATTGSVETNPPTPRPHSSPSPAPPGLPPPAGRTVPAPLPVPPGFSSIGPTGSAPLCLRPTPGASSATPKLVVTHAGLIPQAQSLIDSNPPDSNPPKDKRTT